MVIYNPVYGIVVVVVVIMVPAIGVMAEWEMIYVECCTIYDSHKINF
jgi:hypothetical protein